MPYPWQQMISAMKHVPLQDLWGLVLWLTEAISGGGFIILPLACGVILIGGLCWFGCAIGLQSSILDLHFSSP